MYLLSFIGFVSFIVASQAANYPIECNFSDGEPVCAFDGSRFKLFPNECFLKSYKSEKREWRPTLITECIPNYNLDLDDKTNYKNCKIPCPRIVAEVCGFDGENYQIFDNECVMKQKSCEEKRQKWTKTTMVPCLLRNNPPQLKYRTDECPQICTLDYNPVCGFDGENYKIFSNDCALTVENCNKNNKWRKVQRLQDCQQQFETQQKLQFVKNSLLRKQSVESKTCIKPCTREFNPVCGFDRNNYRIFNNDCMLRNRICLDGHNWKKTDLLQCTNI